ncbi:hypothetical protein ACJX0J_028473, partial [Zea mays]
MTLVLWDLMFMLNVVFLRMEQDGHKQEMNVKPKDIHVTSIWIFVREKSKMKTHPTLRLEANFCVVHHGAGGRAVEGQQIYASEYAQNKIEIQNSVINFILHPEYSNNIMLRLLTCIHGHNVVNRQIIVYLGESIIVLAVLNMGLSF